MTARHATPLLAVEMNEAAGAREIILRDRSGTIPEDLIVELRPSNVGPARAEMWCERWIGTDLRGFSFFPTATQLRVLGSALLAAADQAEAGV